MYDSVNILRSMESFDKAEQFDGFSKVVIIVSDEIEYTSGNDTGRTLTLNCPWGTQEIADNILKSIKGFQYQPMTVGGALVDPSAEIGDGINANDVYSGIYSLGIKFNSNFPSDISAPADEEIDEEFPYKSSQERKVERQNKELRASLSIQAGRITQEVTDRKDQVYKLSSRLDVQSKSIEARVTQEGRDDNSDFWWKLLSTGWEIGTGNKTIFAVKPTGAYVNGEIRATTGKIGNWNINSSSLSYNGQTWGGTNTTGAYVGKYGIQLGKNFKVDMQGNLTAARGTFEGEIRATSGKIGGFDIQSNYLSYNGQTWGGTNTTGAYIGQSGIQLGKNFKVDMSGNLTAASGKFLGSVNAGNIQYGGNAGYFSGSGLSSGSVYGGSGGAIAGSSLSPFNLTGGVNTSLAYADYANGVFNGWNEPDFIKCHTITAMKASLGDINFHGYRLSVKTISYMTPSGSPESMKVVTGAYFGG